MENEKTDPAKPPINDAKAAFVGIGQFDVTLTYGFLAEPIVFPCKILLSSEDREARQAFYSLSKGDQEKGEFDFDLEFMTRVVVGHPAGLPGYVQTDNLKASLAGYFNTGEQILRKIANDFGNTYTREVTPAQLFR